MAWPEGSLLWRIVIWFVLSLGLGFLNYWLIMKAMARAEADPQKGFAKVAPWYIVRMVTNFSMMLLAFFLDGSIYVLLAVLSGLLIMTAVMALSRMRATRAPTNEQGGGA